MTVSVVTGTSTGIGFAIALRLAREGHQVHASVRSAARGQDLLEAADGLDLSLVIMDVDDDDSVAAGIGGVLEATGGIDVLVNNAGMTKGHDIESTSVATFQQVMNTNAWGTLRAIHAVLPSMRERGSGHILNVTSVAGRLAIANQGAYAMSKWAAEALTEVLAAEAGLFGVKVSAIEPGVILTPIFEKAIEDPGDPDSPYVGGRRMGEWFMSSLMRSPAPPDRVAEVVWDAINAPEPKLRYLVGDDAERFEPYRRSITDEEWIARQSVADDDAWWAWIESATGVGRPTP